MRTACALKNIFLGTLYWNMIFDLKSDVRVFSQFIFGGDRSSVYIYRDELFCPSKKNIFRHPTFCGDDHVVTSYDGVSAR